MLKLDSSLCGYCGVCVGICPGEAIKLKGMDIEINPEACNKCGLCVRACPVGALVLEVEDEGRV